MLITSTFTRPMMAAVFAQGIVIVALCVVTVLLAVTDTRIDRARSISASGVVLKNQLDQAKLLLDAYSAAKSPVLEISCKTLAAQIANQTKSSDLQRPDAPEISATTISLPPVLAPILDALANPGIATASSEKRSTLEQQLTAARTKADFIVVTESTILDRGEQVHPMLRLLQLCLIGILPLGFGFMIWRIIRDDGPATK